MEQLERFGSKEIEYIGKAIESGLHNEWNKKFEDLFSETIKADYTIGVNSGTSALHCALAATGIGPGDEVIVPPLTFGAPAFTTVMLGAVPVFADVRLDTYTIDPEDVKKKVTAKTRAVVPVSLYGLPSDIFSIMEIADRHNLLVVEDNAQCIKGKYKGKLTGTVSDMAIYSFQRSKHITSECGGAVTTNSQSLAEAVKKFSILGYATLKAKPELQVVTKEQVQHPDFCRHEFISPNYRLPEICAAMLVAQVEKLDQYIARRKEVARHYADAIRDYDWLVPQKVPDGYEHTYWTYALRIDGEKTDVSWEDFRKVFLANGGQPYYAAWQLNYLEPAMQKLGYVRGLCPVAEKIQPQLIQLKTNLFYDRVIDEQAKILKATAAYFGS